MIISHPPQNPVKELEPLFLAHMRALFKLFRYQRRRKNIRPEEYTVPREVIHDRSLSKAGLKLPGSHHQNIGNPGHSVSRSELAGYDLLPCCVGRYDSDRFDRLLSDIQHKIAHIRIQRRGELVQLSGVELDRVSEQQNVRVNVCAQKFRIRLDKADPERRESPFLPHAADIHQDLAYFLECILRRELLVLLKGEAQFLVTVVNSFNKSSQIPHFSSPNEQTTSGVLCPRLGTKYPRGHSYPLLFKILHHADHESDLDHIRDLRARKPLVKSLDDLISFR